VSANKIRTGIVEGVAFEWWTDGAQPASVTVRSPVFGTATGRTSHDPARFAAALAERRLARWREGREAARKPQRHPSGGVPVLKKPGWFEVDPSDFGTTVL
jgi:hypothetical protein